jgi:hypothetical protein
VIASKSDAFIFESSQNEGYMPFEAKKGQVELTGLAKPITSNYTLAHEAQGQKLCKELHDLFSRQ